MTSRNVSNRPTHRALSLLAAAIAGLSSLPPTAHAVTPPTSATIVPNTLTQGTLQSSLSANSYANESNHLDDWPLTTGGSSFVFPITLTNADFNGSPFGGTPNTLVAFGPAGGVTLHLTSPIHPVPGQKEIGLFTAQMLLSPAGALFNGDMEASLLVSPDNTTWYTLAGQPIPSPTTYTANPSPLNAPTLAYNFGTLQRAWSYGSGTPASNLSSLPVADYQTPMPDDSLFNDPASTNAQRQSLSSNSSPNDYAAIFGPSAGGNWFDLDATGLPEINYLRLNAAPTSAAIRLDALYATPASSTPLPEPASLALLALTAAPLFPRRPRHR